MSADDQPDQVTYTVLASTIPPVRFMLCVPDGTDLEDAVMAELETLGDEGKLPQTDRGVFTMVDVTACPGLSLTDDLAAVAEYNTGEVKIDASETVDAPADYRHVLKDRAGRRYRFAYLRRAVVAH
jgi:hypothetical protein